jgi:hypothetical protein
MNPDELPADMEGRLRMRLNDLAALGSMKITTAPGERIVILDVVQGTRALLKAYQEQRRALEFYADPISYALTQVSEPRSTVHGDDGKRARAALTGEDPRPARSTPHLAIVPTPDENAVPIALGDWTPNGAPATLTGDIHD